MSNQGHQNVAKYLIVGLVILNSMAASSHAQDKGAPPWGEFLKRFNKDPLLKEPFHMSEASEVKGLASKIRARELDIPNRKRAIRYLKDLDCTQFPEAKKMLVSLLKVDPNDEKYETEKWEEVRYEAAKGLRDMLARHSCNPDADKDGKGGKSKNKNGNCQSCPSSECDDSLWQQCCSSASNVQKRMRGERTEPQQPPCHCTSCCDADTLNALARTAYEMNEKGCCYEPSLRVREMAVEAIKACGVPCHYKPYYGETDEEPGPPAFDESGKKVKSSGEDVPQEKNEDGTPPTPSDDATETMPSVTDVVTPISRLTNLCIVSLAHGQKHQPNPQISATYRGRIYYFSSADAKQEFLGSPDRYAVAFGGCDPVQFVRTQQVVEGRFLAEHEGRFFMFASQENYDTFKASPDRYIPKSAHHDRVASNL